MKFLSVNELNLKAGTLRTQHGAPANGADLEAVHCATDAQSAIFRSPAQLGHAHTAAHHLGSILNI